MIKSNIHMEFRDVVSVNLLFAALERSFPLFHNDSDNNTVDEGGKVPRETVFDAIRRFSTSFPHNAVDAKGQ